ncbi:hypothetical protein Tel_05210 [Candidatus Tenderia electrophaga]|jgi:spermidine synthase|uniref:PABS domain-containing protein n=1 Tax=Candidatus Tenderia electrophaga TaxID=1748243 RepID=A0A0S2TBS8_9GAMM|nr:hypothetical protein Tel_05210 [Candidatus Tenderia electrophaga]
MHLPEGELIHVRHSPWHTIEVSQNEDVRVLRTDRRAVQSALNLKQPQQLALRYMQAMMAGLLFQPPPSKVLLLGLGGGDLVRHLHHYLPQVRLEVVELDEVIVDVCRDWFALPQSERLTVNVDDAANFVVTTRERFDWLLVDIYSDSGVPAPLIDSGFYQGCYDALNHSGMLVINLITDDAETFKSILQRLRRQFDCNTLCLSVPGHINIIVFAFRQRPTRLSSPALSRRAIELNKRFEMNFSEWAQQLFSTNPTEGGELMF